jgi:hypothetical protein
MKDDFNHYLKGIGITELFFERSKKLFELFSSLIEEDIMDIFVSEYIDGEGKRNYEEILFFTKSRIIEARQFLTKDDYFFNCTLNCPVSGFVILPTEYDFVKATDKSKLNVNVYLRTELIINMKASRENCDYLKEILKKYFFPADGSSYCTVK